MPNRLAAATLAALAATPAQADATGAAAALDRMIASQEAVLDTLEAIGDEASLEQNRAALLRQLAQARADSDALADHAATFEASRDLRRDFTERMRVHTERRDAVYDGVLERLDEAALDKLDDIYDEAD